MDATHGLARGEGAGPEPCTADHTMVERSKVYTSPSTSPVLKQEMRSWEMFLHLTNWECWRRGLRSDFTCLLQTTATLESFEYKASPHQLYRLMLCIQGITASRSCTSTTCVLPAPAHSTPKNYELFW